MHSQKLHARIFTALLTIQMIRTTSHSISSAIAIASSSNPLQPALKHSGISCLRHNPCVRVANVHPLTSHFTPVTFPLRVVGISKAGILVDTSRRNNTLLTPHMISSSHIKTSTKTLILTTKRTRFSTRPANMNRTFPTSSHWHFTLP